MAPSLTFSPALYIIAGSGSGSIGYTVLVSNSTYRTTLVRLRRTTFQAWASISLVIDVIIASAMVWSVRS
jgi:hypothetical protein